MRNVNIKMQNAEFGAQSLNLLDNMSTGDYSIN